MDHMGIDAANSQPTRQPKAIAPGLICDGNPCDLLPGLDGFVAPAIQKPQQHLWVRSDLLEWFAIDARNHAGNEPVRQAHFKDTDIMLCISIPKRRSIIASTPGQDGHCPLSRATSIVA